MNEPNDIAEAMLKMSAIIEPGTTGFVIFHTGDEGLVPPPEQGVSEHPGFTGDGGTGDGHCFGPFVNEEEAAEWQALADKVRPCPCRKAILELVIPRFIAVIGPAGVPIDVGDQMDRQHAKDRLN